MNKNEKKSPQKSNTAVMLHQESRSGFFSIPSYNGVSFVNALSEIGVDSSFANRERIANMNGISNYTGTAAQNEMLLNLLMNGYLRYLETSGGSGGNQSGGSFFPRPDYNGITLVGALQAIDVDSSFANRERIASGNEISNYLGTTEQNNMLFNLLMKGQLRQPRTSDGSSNVGKPTNPPVVTIPSLGQNYRLIDSRVVSIRNPNYIPGSTSGSNRPFFSPLRRRSDITRIVIHHTAGSDNSTRQSIENHWRTLGWWNGGYHEMIHANGDVELCYNPEVQTNGVANHNQNTYHIAFVGHTTPTAAQRASLIARSHHWMRELGLPYTSVLGHGEIAPSFCPGMSMSNFRSEIRNV